MKKRSEKEDKTPDLAPSKATKSVKIRSLSVDRNADSLMPSSSKMLEQMMGKGNSEWNVNKSVAPTTMRPLMKKGAPVQQQQKYAKASAVLGVEQQQRKFQKAHEYVQEYLTEQEQIIDNVDDDNDSMGDADYDRNEEMEHMKMETENLNAKKPAKPPQRLQQTNKGLLSRFAAGLLQKQSECLTEDMAARRTRYIKPLTSHPLEEIPTWDSTDVDAVAEQWQKDNPQSKAHEKASKKSKKSKKSSSAPEEAPEENSPNVEFDYSSIPQAKTFSGDLNKLVSLHHGNIMCLEIDAVIISTASGFRKTEIIREAQRVAGPCFEQETEVLKQQQKPPPLDERGDACIACGYNAPAYYIICASGPGPKSTMTTRRDHLVGCLAKSFQLAIDYACRSIAIPCISTGGRGMNPVHNANITIEFVRDWLEANAPSPINRIIFCTFTDDDKSAYWKTMPSYFPLCPTVEKTCWYADYFKDFENRTCYPLDDIQRRISSHFFSQLNELNLSGADFLNDMFFWALLASKKRFGLTKLDCTACTSFTDMALTFAVPFVFPLLKTITFDGCPKITEFSLIRLIESSAFSQLSTFSLVATGVRTFSEAVEKAHDVIVKLNGCPLIKPFGLERDPRKNASTAAAASERSAKACKLIVVRPNSRAKCTALFSELAKLAINKADSETEEGVKPIRSLFLNLPTSGELAVELNVFEVSESALPLVGTVGAAFAIDTVDNATAADLGLHVAQMYPMATIFVRGEAKTATAVREKLFKTQRGLWEEFDKETPRQLQEMTYAEQLRSASAAAFVFHSMSVRCFQFETTTAMLDAIQADASNATIFGRYPACTPAEYVTVARKISKKIAEQKMAVTLRSFIKSLRKNAPFTSMSFRATKAIAEIFFFMGECLIVPATATANVAWVVVGVDKFKAFLANLCNEKNASKTAKYGKLFPWLPPTSLLFKVDDAAEKLQALCGVEEASMDVLASLGVVLKFPEPYMALRSSEAVGTLAELLPTEPAAPLEHYRPQNPDSDSQDVGMRYELIAPAPSALLAGIISVFAEVSLPALIWQRGIVSHVGPVELFVTAGTDKTSENFIDFSAQTISFAKFIKKDTNGNVIDSAASKFEAKARGILCRVFQNFRSLIEAALVKYNVCAKLMVKCSRCQNTPHYFPVGTVLYQAMGKQDKKERAVAKCPTSNVGLTPEELGLSEDIAANFFNEIEETFRIWHSLVETPESQSFQRCPMCRTVFWSKPLERMVSCDKCVACADCVEKLKEARETLQSPVKITMPPKSFPHQISGSCIRVTSAPFVIEVKLPENFYECSIAVTATHQADRIWLCSVHDEKLMTLAPTSNLAKIGCSEGDTLEIRVFDSNRQEIIVNVNGESTSVSTMGGRFGFLLEKGASTLVVNTRTPLLVHTYYYLQNAMVFEYARTTKISSHSIVQLDTSNNMINVDNFIEHVTDAPPGNRNKSKEKRSDSKKPAIVEQQTVTASVRIPGPEAETPVERTFYTIGKVYGFAANGQLSIECQDDGTRLEVWLSDENVHPIGYADHANVPKEQMVGGVRNSLDYEAFFNGDGAGVPLPREFFSQAQSNNCPMPQMGWSQSSTFEQPKRFEKMMRLEAVDRKNPGLICVATIQDIMADGQLLIHFDGLPEKYDYVCAPSDPDLHPIGYCEQLGNKLQAPKGWAGEHSGEFRWEKYLIEKATIPVPFTLFTAEQKGGCAEKAINLGGGIRIVETISLEIMHCMSCEHLFCVNLDNAKLFNASAKGLLFERLTDPTHPANVSGHWCLLPQGAAATVNVAAQWPARRLVQTQSISAHSLVKVCVRENHYWSNQSENSLGSMLTRSVFHHMLDSKPLAADAVIEEFSTAQAATAAGKSASKKTVASTPNLADMLRVCFEQLPIIVFPGLSDPTTITPFKVELTNLQVYEAYVRFSYLYQSTACCLMPDVTTAVTSEELKEIAKRFQKIAAKTATLEDDRRCTRHVSKQMAPLALIYHLRPTVANPGAPPETYDYIESFTINRSGPVARENAETGKMELVRLPDVMTEIMKNALSKNLSKLELQCAGLETLPDSIKNLAPTLTNLTISRNPFKEFPEVVCTLKRLIYLEAFACSLTAVPESIGNLQQLISLNLGSNSLTIEGLPKGLGKLKKLQNLFLDGIQWFDRHNEGLPWDTFKSTVHGLLMMAYAMKNDEELAKYIQEETEITGFKGAMIEQPEQIAKLNRLIYKNFGRFKRAAPGTKSGELEGAAGFPLVVLQLSNLRILSLGYHGFESVSPLIGTLRKLTSLSLASNMNLLSVPSSLGILPIRTLDLSRCDQLITPPAATIKRGTDAIMAYLRTLRRGSTACKRTKLMLVGLGGAGKTSLAKALISSNYRTAGTTSAESITDGIDIAEWTVRTVSNETIQYSVWDFAGQAVYYNTHQFFISNRAIYFLLWNTRLGYEHAGLDFWLSSISCHAPEAPIFVIGTHADQVKRFDLPQTELQQTYPTIKHFTYVSSLTGDGVYELSEKLHEVTLQQKYMGVKVPTNYLDFEKDLLQMRKKTQILALTEARDLARKQDIIGIQEVQAAISLLHDLGSLQYFSNELLRDHIIISPQWLVDAMACLISVKENVIEEGRFKRKDVATIWSKYSQNLHDWLLRLTEEFDLTFCVPPGDVNVVPCLLPEQEPEIDWPKITDNAIKEMKHTYKFQYLPAGLFNRLQTRLYEYSDSSAIWKKGSLLHKNNHKAIVRQTKDKELIVKVQGPRPENMLLLVHEVIESLVTEFFKGVNYELLVPCMDCVNSGSQDAHQFSSSQVNRAEKLKAPFLQCTKQFHLVSISALRFILPPTNLIDYQAQTQFTVRDLMEIQGSVADEIALLCCTTNIEPKTKASTKGVCPTRIQRDLQDALKSEQAVEVCLVTNDDALVGSTSLKIANARLILCCISNEFCANEDCQRLFAFAKQHATTPLIPVIVGTAGDAWKQSNIGMQLSTEVYVDMQNADRYELGKFKELVSRVRLKLDRRQNVAQRQKTFPPVFISYCWTNSHAAAKTGRKPVDGALGEVDPRDLKTFLKDNADANAWLDVDETGEGGLFEDIAEGLRHAKLVIVCVSDEYIASRNCMLEYRFAVSVLKIPIVLAIFGTGKRWQTSEVTFLSMNAQRIDFQTRLDASFDALANFVKKTLNRRPTSASAVNAARAQQANESFTAYQEIRELAQRTFLQQASLMATKVRKELEAPKSYPRLLFIDLADDVDVAKIADVANPLAKMEQACLRLLCEEEKGWHIASTSYELTAFALYGDDMETLLDKVSMFQLHVLTILKASGASNAKMMQYERADQVLKDFERRAKKGTSTLESSYKKLHELSFALDTRLTRGGMLRSYLHSRRLVWLCADHQSIARTTLPNNVEGDAEEEAAGIGSSLQAGENTVVRPPSALAVDAAQEEPSKPSPSMTPTKPSPPDGAAAVAAPPREERPATVKPPAPVATPAREEAPNAPTVAKNGPSAKAPSPASSATSSKKPKSKLCLLM